MWTAKDRRRWKHDEGLSAQKRRLLGLELGMTTKDAHDLDAFALVVAAKVMLDADERIALREAYRAGS